MADPVAEYSVADESAGQRLDQWLRSQLPEHSRAYLQKLIDQGRVTVNARPCKASHRVRGGDRVAVEIPPPRPLEAQPEAIPLAVLYEDEDVVVIDKPAGLVVHPAAGHAEHTLVNALLHHCRGRLAGIGGALRPGIVHRLDKGTSGCLVVAKTDLAHQDLIRQFQARTVRKIYRAVCQGRFDPPAGIIETVIGRSDRDRKKMSARVTRGRPAVTEYRVLQQFDDCALVELALHTGRTHQIRVHMAHLGHPVLGDRVYGGRISNLQSPISNLQSPISNLQSPISRLPSPIALARPLLHAYKLGFRHPRTGRLLEFQAPMPPEFRPWMA